MTDNGKVIVDTFRQMQEIYKQVSLLLSKADTLMTGAQWSTDNPIVLYNTSTYLQSYDRWSPSIIRRTYINEKFPKLRKYIAVKMVSEKRSESQEEAEPVVIGTTLLGCEDTPVFWGWDAYWWWEQEGDGKIEQPTKVNESEDRGLAEIHIISCPFVDITSSEKLQECIIGPLLEYTG